MSTYHRGHIGWTLPFQAWSLEIAKRHAAPGPLVRRSKPSFSAAAAPGLQQMSGMSRCFRVRISRSLAQALEEGLKRESYGPRQKGRWVGEALEQLQREDPMLAKVGVGDRIDVPLDRSIALSLRREHFQLLVDLVLRFREAAPLVDGVRALVVRSAIRARIRSSAPRAPRPQTG